MNPFDYSLCAQTVTVYRCKEGAVTRQVVDNAYLSATASDHTQSYGKSLEKTFRLIIPGDFPLLPGDRIYEGLGPEEISWQTFLPALVPELYEAGYAKACCWEGTVIHWEAGSRKEHL